MLYRIEKRSDISKEKSIGIRALAILLALITSGAFIFLLKLNPIDVYLSMLDGAFGSPYRIRETIITAIPLLITSLGLAIAFTMQFWNIGGEGQILMGAFFASFIALNYPDIPKPILLTLMMIAGILGGGLWALIPAFFKAQWGTNETIVTLMLNYIALKWITFLQYGPWRDPDALGFPKVPNFSPNAILPKVFGVHIGWIIALILVVLVYIFMKHSKKGYEIAVLGESENTARYAGINIKKTILVSIFLSGSIAGLAGMIQASAVSKTLAVSVSGGMGFTAIITTWLAALNPIFILVSSILFAALIRSGSFIQTAFGIPSAAASIIQAMILFFFLGSHFFIKYRITRKTSAKIAQGGE